MPTCGSACLRPPAKWWFSHRLIVVALRVGCLSTRNLKWSPPEQNVAFYSYVKGKPSSCASIDVPANSLQLARNRYYIIFFSQESNVLVKKSVPWFLYLYVFSIRELKKWFSKCCFFMWVCMLRDNGAWTIRWILFIFNNQEFIYFFIDSSTVLCWALSGFSDLWLYVQSLGQLDGLTWCVQRYKDCSHRTLLSTKIACDNCSLISEAWMFVCVLCAFFLFLHSLKWDSQPT
jgi:hypothetical protein